MWPANREQSNRKYFRAKLGTHVANPKGPSQMNDAQPMLADLEAIYTAGKATLPNVAQVFGSAGQCVHATSGSESAAFTFTGAGAGAGVKHLHAQWAALRDTLRDRILAPTQQSLLTSGQALVQVAGDYAQQDGDNAKAIKDLDTRLAVNGDGVPANKPPTSVTTVPKHDDPATREYPKFN
jgi:phospholipase/lecithinase/hemolysin